MPLTGSNSLSTCPFKLFESLLSMDEQSDRQASTTKEKGEKNRLIPRIVNVNPSPGILGDGFAGRN